MHRYTHKKETLKHIHPASVKLPAYQTSNTANLYTLAIHLFHLRLYINTELKCLYRFKRAHSQKGKKISLSFFFKEKVAKNGMKQYYTHP